MSNYRKALLGLILLLIVYAIVELASFLAYFATEDEFFSFSKTRATMNDVVEQANSADPTNFNKGILVAQPYWGYVNSGRWANMSIRHLDQVRALTRLDREIPTRSANTVNVVVFGGSVAAQTISMGSKQLIEELQKFEDFRGRNILVYSASQGALKQPQQITKLSYLLALGSEFDIIINIDGLNEIVVSTRLSEQGIFPFFPKYWSKLHEEVGSSASIQLVAETTFLRERRMDLSRLGLKPPIRFSVTANTMWLYLDRYLSSQISQRRVQLHDASTKDTYVEKGPKFPLRGQDPLPEEIAATWKRGSLGLDALSDKFGAKYFHFLQPNQYLPNSKPLHSTERKQAFQEDSDVNLLVPSIYPLLIERGKQLHSGGVNFFDLTMIFKDQEEIRYIDTCCHLNENGAQELAREVGRSIVNRLEEQEKSAIYETR